MREGSCSRRGASSCCRSPPFMLYMQLLSFVSAHYCKCIFKARQLWAKPQLWCDKFIFTKMCNPMLPCFCRSPALLAQTRGLSLMEENLLLKCSVWIISDNGRNTFNGVYFSIYVKNKNHMFVPKKTRAIPVINVTALPPIPFQTCLRQEGKSA